MIIAEHIRHVGASSSIEWRCLAARQRMNGRKEKKDPGLGFSSPSWPVSKALVNLPGIPLPDRS